jgi:hypothetical protein
MAVPFYEKLCEFALYSPCTAMAVIATNTVMLLLCAQVGIWSGAGATTRCFHFMIRYFIYSDVYKTDESEDLEANRGRAYSLHIT